MKVKKFIAIASLLISLAVVGWSQSPQSVTLTANIPGPPSGVNVYTTGATGSTLYCYYVVAVYNAGMGTPSQPTCIYNSNGTLSGSNFNTITWSGTPPGGVPIGWWVLRSTGYSFPGTGTTAVNATVIAAGTYSQTDQSNSLNSFTFSPLSAGYATIGLDNLNYGQPAIVVGDAVGNTDIKWYQIAISPAGTTQSQLYTRVGYLGLSQINGGTVIVPGINGVSYRVVDFLFQGVGSNLATCTSVNVDDTTGTPVVVAAVPVATLASNAVIGPGGANNTLTTMGWQGALTAGKGIQIINAGSSCTAATGLYYRIEWTTN